MGTILAILAVQQSGGLSALSLLVTRPVQAAETRGNAVRTVDARVTSAVETSEPLLVERELRQRQPGNEPNGALAPEAPASRPRLWRGSIIRNTYVRATPSRKAILVGELQAGQSIEVVGWVRGEEVEPDNPTWADLGAGRYAYSAALRREPLAGAPDPPPRAPSSGRWIDVNLTSQTATAYDGTTPVRTVLISSGRPGWETARGAFKVERRVEKETMDGASLIGQGPNGAGAQYKLENVRWTQYFSADGSALHENYWRNPATFGIPGSHGCIGMLSRDAVWFWSFATIGTPIIIH